MTFVKAYIGETPLFEAGSAGATILKTGQTVSYATGDDGDLEAGRAVDFFTLAANNPFGNTSRFTALNGSQTYANDIIIDWSTYDGSNVVGYYRGSMGVNRVFADSLIWASRLNIAGYTNWRLTNIRELLNLCNYEVASSVLGWTPLIAPSNSFWSSTTVNNLSTAAYTCTGGVGAVSSSTGKTSNARTIACRSFTVTGTTLT